MAALEKGNQGSMHGREPQGVVEMLGDCVLRYQAVFENSLDGMVLFDDSLHFLDANPAICQLLGYSREELLQLTLEDITPVPNRVRIPELLNAFLAAGTLTGEYTLMSKNGAFKEVEYRAVTNILPGLHLCIERDITDRKSLERHVLNAAGKEQLRIGQELCADVGQELTALCLLAETLAAARDKLPSSEVAIAAKVLEGLQRTLRKVQAISQGLIPMEVDSGTCNRS